MVGQEPEQINGGVGQRDPGPGRPHAGDERQHEVPDEVLGEAADGEERAEGQVVDVVTRRGVGMSQQPLGGAVEALHLREQAQVGQVPGAARLGEQARDPAGAGVLQTAALAGDRHAHLGRLRGDAELAEQPQQVGVGLLVVHDEPTVDRHRPPGGAGDVVGVGVAPQAIVGLEEGDVVCPLQQVRGGQPSNSGADDGGGRPA